MTVDPHPLTGRRVRVSCWSGDSIYGEIVAVATGPRGCWIGVDIGDGEAITVDAGRVTIVDERPTARVFALEELRGRGL